MADMAEKVGFVGLGNIGKPMALHIAPIFDLMVFDIAPDALTELENAGARIAANLAELGTQCEFVGVCVRDDSQVESVALGTSGLLENMQPDSILSIHSTVHPRTITKIQRHARERGIHVVDAPITGGAPGANNKTLCYMVGGEDKIIDRVQPIFETSGNRIVRAGETGKGAVAKLCNNLMTYMGFLAAVEASLLAEKAGLDASKMHEVTETNGNLTPQMKLILALHKAAATNRDPVFLKNVQAFVELAEKDLGITLEYAAELGLKLPGTDTSQKLMAQVYGLKKW
ncbi:MAG: NAD(P)-dependent oxidoreductase [Deltaproteobacteria bacterium]|nr:NAD(P)-dependent oxidoreductase [Deltaproteobacteria bacterium]